jgi:hypothetical protein
MKLKSSNYEGHITVKVSPKEMGVWESSEVMKHLEYTKKYYEKHFLNYKND